MVDVDGTRGIGYYPKILRDLPKAPPCVLRCVVRRERAVVGWTSRGVDVRRFVRLPALVR